nr:hypothetical protein KPHV_84970 [Kitasatospora purpeofusca]
MRAVVTGSAVLTRRIRARFRRTQPTPEAGHTNRPVSNTPRTRRRSLNGDHLGKAIIGIFVAIALLRLVRPALVETVAGLVVLWVGSAWVLAPPPAPDTPRAVPAGSRGGNGESLDQPPGAAATTPTPDPLSSHASLVAWVEHQIAEASSHRTGLHVVELLHALRAEGTDPGLTQKTLLRALRAAQIPVRSGLGAKIEGKKYTRAGVHARDLETWLGRALQHPGEARHSRPVREEE